MRLIRVLSFHQSRMLMTVNWKIEWNLLASGSRRVYQTSKTL